MSRTLETTNTTPLSTRQPIGVADVLANQSMKLAIRIIILKNSLIKFYREITRTKMPKSIEAYITAKKYKNSVLHRRPEYLLYVRQDYMNLL